MEGAIHMACRFICNDMAENVLFREWSVSDITIPHNEQCLEAY